MSKEAVKQDFKKVVEELKWIIEYQEKENIDKLQTETLKKALAIIEAPGNENCEYCISIKNATKASPKKRYKYCPICGVRIERR